MQIYILTEGGANIGFGHIMRCGALYEAFAGRGFSPLMVVNGDKSLEPSLQGRNHIVIDWRTESLPLLHHDLIIIDSYLAPEEYYADLAQKVKVMVYLDDTGRISYPPGIIINSLIDGEFLYRPLSGKIHYLLGPSYALLRDPFQGPFSKTIRQRIERIMVTLGGEDRLGLMPKLLEYLQFKCPDIELTAIIGPGFKNREDIEKAKGDHTILVYSPDGPTIAKIMTDSDLAISAGGQTLLELARTGTPTIAIAIADNQTYQIEKLEEADVIRGIGTQGTPDFWSQLNQAYLELNHFSIRKKMSAKGQHLVDGQGSRRAVDEILNHYAKLNRKFQGEIEG